MRSVALGSACPLAGHRLHLRGYSPQASCRAQPTQCTIHTCQSVSNSSAAHAEGDDVSDQAAKPQQSAAAAQSWVKAVSTGATSAAVFAVATLASLTYQALSHAELPPVSPAAEVLPKVLVISAAGVGVTLALAKLLLGDTFHIEWHRGRLYLQAGVPSQGPAINPADCIVTQPTGDERGNGAYATQTIPAGSHVADYSGQLLDREAFFTKYPNGVGDYAMAIDQEWVIDAADQVACTSVFHPVHMNHSRNRANVLRYYNRSRARVAFFASRDIQPGEELLYDYGRAYWRGREHLELP